mgnify:CR=1 FL=1
MANTSSLFKKLQGPSRRPYKQGPEELEMTLFFDFVRYKAFQDERLHSCYHIPNEGKASIQRRLALARAGVKKGIPDICVPIPNDSYHALYIELKVKPNKPTQAQKECIEHLNKLGNYAVVCYSGSEAIQTLEKYLANEIRR